MINYTTLFLAQSYRDSWDDYQRSLTSPDFACWDYIVLTASDEHQAECFRAQLAERAEAGLLPQRTKFAVIPDEGGRRVGSGGATLGVLRYLTTDLGRDDFSGLRLLVIHSGGDSKRVPQYSALGKLFSPVPHELPNGQAGTLFDEFLVAAASVPSRIRDGMLLLSGDVLLLFNPMQIDYGGKDAAAISFKEDVSTGKDHGVFLRGDDGNVRRFLHKQTVSMLQSCGAVNERGCVDIDTGAVLFSPEMLRALCNLISTDGKADDAKYASLVNDRVRLSLYGDFLFPLAEDSTFEQFLQEKPEGTLCPELLTARKLVWDALRPYRMKLLRLAPAKFIHFGTTREILQLMSGGVEDYAALGWSRQINSSIDGSTAGYNAVVSNRAEVGENCYFEDAYIHHGSHIGAGTLISFLDVHGETIPGSVVLHGLKQRDGRFVARIYGVGDNPKDGPNGSFLGTTLCDFLNSHGISEEEVWDSGDRTIWNASLYPACASVREAVDAALNVYALAHGKGDLEAWRRADRKSLCAGFRDADPTAIIAWDKRMRELVRMDRLEACIRAGVPAEQAASVLGADHLTKIQREWLEKRLGQLDFSQKLRLNYYVGRAIGGAEGSTYVADCFRTVSESVQAASLAAMQYRPDIHITADCCKVQMPLRVNWGGGWSDTPPYCIENGGTVLNASILLNGRMPVEVTLERIDELKIVFDSRDMDVHGEFDTILPLQSTGDPYDPFALQKACLLACGVLPRSGGDLREILSRLGGGFVIRSEVTGVPKGSGLGTSSILSAACVKAVLCFCGIPFTEDELYAHVLCMEQIMSTGGGWQDQVGGVTNGIKYITSAPGMAQKVLVTHVSVPEAAMAELQERFALIYTGQRRLARHLLRDVVGRYVGNDPEALSALDEIQRVAALMRFELERGNVDAFAELLDRHWTLSQKVDGGSTNTLIDQIFASVDEFVDGRLVCGAGGGGFLQVILKKGVDRQSVRERLRDVFGDSDVDLWDCTLV